MLNGFLGLMVMAVVAVAQEPEKEKEAPKKEPPKAAVPEGKAPEAKAPATKSESGGFVKLAPGVIITIPLEKQKAEENSTHDLLRLLEKDPAFGERQNPNKPGSVAVSNLAKNVRLPHNVWALEFNFKSMRHDRGRCAPARREVRP